MSKMAKNTNISCGSKLKNSPRCAPEAYRIMDSRRTLGSVNLTHSLCLGALEDEKSYWDFTTHEMCWHHLLVRYGLRNSEIERMAKRDGRGRKSCFPVVRGFVDASTGGNREVQQLLDRRKSAIESSVQLETLSANCTPTRTIDSASARFWATFCITKVISVA